MGKGTLKRGSTKRTPDRCLIELLSNPIAGNGVILFKINAENDNVSISSSSFAIIASRDTMPFVVADSLAPMPSTTTFEYLRAVPKRCTPDSLLNDFWDPESKSARKVTCSLSLSLER